MQNITVSNQSHPLHQPLIAGRCDSFMTRLRGFMFHSPVEPDRGLLFIEGRASRIDSAIHMFFVGFDLATIWLDREGKVVDTVLARRWRPFYMPSRPACFILEAHPNRLGEFQIGDQITFENA